MIATHSVHRNSLQYSINLLRIYQRPLKRVLLIVICDILWNVEYRNITYIYNNIQSGRLKVKRVFKLNFGRSIIYLPQVEIDLFITYDFIRFDIQKYKYETVCKEKRTKINHFLQISFIVQSSSFLLTVIDHQLSKLIIIIQHIFLMECHSFISKDNTKIN